MTKPREKTREEVTAEIEGKPDWLPGFPVQIYCNRRDKG